MKKLPVIQLRLQIIIENIEHDLPIEMRFRRFLKQHPVFTVNELDIYLEQTGSSNRNTRNSLLRHHKKAGRIIPIRRRSLCDGTVGHRLGASGARSLPSGF